MRNLLCITGIFSFRSRKANGRKGKKSSEERTDFYRKRGVNLYLEGRASSPGHIARACAVAENGTYMRDYSQDEKGRLKRIDFNFVEKE